MIKGTAAALVVLAVIVGGLSMGCIGVPEPEEPENPTIAGLTAKGLQVKADVAERQARGFVQYTGTIENVTVTASEVEVITYKDAPIIYYCRCYPKYPDNVAGFDTPMERAYVYQGMLNDKVASIDSLTVSQYIPGYREKIAYIEYYQGYYQDLQDKYQKMYCTVGNKEIGDFVIERAENITANGSA